MDTPGLQEVGNKFNSDINMNDDQQKISKEKRNTRK